MEREKICAKKGVKNGSREGALSRGAITGLGVKRGLTLLDLYPAPRGFLRFFPLPIFIVNICSFGFYLFFAAHV